MNIIIKRRNAESIPEALAALPPLLQRIYAARGIQTIAELEHDFKSLPAFADLKDIEAAVQLLVEVLEKDQRILILGDYDADGATSSALMVSALREMGATQVDFLVPNRFEFGYGLTPELVDLARMRSPELIITVDNGISSVEGVARAKQNNIRVLITDHHLPGLELPAADAIINPNQKNDIFPSKNLAGGGVCFYVIMALRAHLRAIGWFEKRGIPEPALAPYLDLVALGTIADVVSLDHTNRILVSQGLRRIRAGKARPGIHALAWISQRSLNKVKASDLAFALAPRLNAAGRMDDMSIGINCLLANEFNAALPYAEKLNTFNQERRRVEFEMHQAAIQKIPNFDNNSTHQMGAGLCCYHPEFHPGVVGILAGRLKERYHRPVIVFAKSDEKHLKGSARSISSVNIRDALANIARRVPGIMVTFGGHAMAGGVTIREENYEQFNTLFAEEIAQWVDLSALQGVIWSDGNVALEQCDWEFVEKLQAAGPWGQSFPEPIFDDEFEIIDQRLVGQKHLKLTLKRKQSASMYDAIAFNVDIDRWPNEHCHKIFAAYRLDVNEFNGLKKVQLIIEHFDMTS